MRVNLLATCRAGEHMGMRLMASPNSGSGPLRRARARRHTAELSVSNG